jgi:two-component system phosphoglycerate transport system response regulator PgtA
MAEPRAIVLVDDDRDFLEMNASVLASRGYAVRCFSDPHEALAAIRSGEPGTRPSLVITDLMMKALNSGFSFARSQRADPRFAGVPVIIVSAVASQKGFDFHPRSPADLAAMHADAFFDKPVDPAALLAKVEELLA